MDPKTRQYLAGGAFALLVVAVVVLQFVPSEAANSLSSRLEGAMGMALAALLVETGVRAKATPAAMLVLVLGLFFVAGVGCGGSTGVVDAEEPAAGVDTALLCDVTIASCAGCELADQRYCSSDDADDGVACVLTEELCGVCRRAQARWCGPSTGGGET